MVFDFIEKTIVGAVENTLDVAEGLLDGELPSKRQIGKLISDGMTVAMLAEAYGVAESVIEDMIND